MKKVYSLVKVTRSNAYKNLSFLDMRQKSFQNLKKVKKVKKVKSKKSKKVSLGARNMKKVSALINAQQHRAPAATPRMDPETAASPLKRSAAAARSAGSPAVRRGADYWGRCAMRRRRSGAPAGSTSLLLGRRGLLRLLLRHFGLAAGAERLGWKAARGPARSVSGNTRRLLQRLTWIPEQQKDLRNIPRRRWIAQALPPCSGERTIGDAWPCGANVQGHPRGAPHFFLAGADAFAFFFAILGWLRGRRG